MTRYYCTGVGPVSPGTNSCCQQHDKDYGAKGRVSRAEADRRLRQCMIAQDKPVLAWLFWAACRLGGWYFWKDKTHDHD
ncbi:DUF1353 domain-containing protein [Aeromonas hydrophila]|uniref:DUF1353 domain-containing protein n=1 Tax=Aeromonas hydrophila TaxID=644 RepID=UPI001860E271|nr:DUF1353 domain-containing protein [Aeromonas hydrophila]MBW3809711.1 hypothetical protein [Aeromonas hydrophila]QNF21644.1 hypothetical protein FT688_20865 [Aeromonas hydrophila]